MEVEFRRREDGGSLAIVERDDGVRLRLWSYDRTDPVPHDAVHLIAERSLGIQGGLWGSIAAGALFGSIEVVDLDGPGVEIRLDRAWGITEVGPAPFSREQATRAVEELRALRAQWTALAPGEAGLPFTWTSPRRAGSGGRRR